MIEVNIFLNEDRCGLCAVQSSTRLAKYKVPEMLSKIHFLSPHYLVCSSLKKPLLYVWNIGQDFSVQKYVLPGMALSLASSPCGVYLAVAADNYVKFWHLPSGQLINTVSNHYQKIEVLTWSHDGRLIISGGHDNNVNVWEFHKILHEKSNCTPLYSFTNHSMAVTDLFCGYGCYKSRLFTSSLDNTCNIYKLSTGKLIITLEFPCPVFKILVDICERYVYAVSVTTDVYRVSLTTEPEKDISKSMKPFITCPNKITSCCLTDSDQAIVIATSENELIKYCAMTGQVLPNSFKSKTQVFEMMNIVLPSYKRNDKPVPYPFPHALQRATTGIMSECSMMLEVTPRPLLYSSNNDFHDLVKEAMAEEEQGSETISDLKQKVGELSALSDKLVSFATDNLVGS